MQSNHSRVFMMNIQAITYNTTVNYVCREYVEGIGLFFIFTVCLII